MLADADRNSASPRLNPALGGHCQPSAGAEKERAWWRPAAKLEEKRQPGGNGAFTITIENLAAGLNGEAEIQYRLCYGHEMGPEAGAFDSLHCVRTRAIATGANGHIPEEARGGT